MTCHIGSCQRHKRCMYTPCRNPSTVLALDVVTAPALEAAKERVRKVAKGATINGTYRMFPEQALDAFRADLLFIVGE